jgi:hypothetical protein
MEGVAAAPSLQSGFIRAHIGLELVLLYTRLGAYASQLIM